MRFASLRELEICAYSVRSGSCSGRRTSMTRSETFAISSAECVLALGQMGFVVVRREPGNTVLASERAIVRVPDVLVVSPDLLGGILVTARVSHADFFQVLEELTTQQELKCLDL